MNNKDLILILMRLNVLKDPIQLKMFLIVLDLLIY